MNILTQWGNTYRHSKNSRGLAKLLCDSDWEYHSWVIKDDLSIRLRNLDTETQALLKTLLNSSSSKAAAHGAIALLWRETYASATLFIRHFEKHIDGSKWSVANNSPAWWIQKIVVEKFKLPYWNLPIDQESEIFGVLKTLYDERITAGEWLVECLVKHQDKTNHIVGLLRHRDVATLDEMEALLSDGVPVLLSQGAL